MSDLSAAAGRDHRRARRRPRAHRGSNRTLWGDVRYELVRNPVFWISSVAGDRRSC